MNNTSTNISLSNNLTAIVTATAVSILGVTIAASQFDTAKGYVERARQATPSVPSLNVSGYGVTLKFAEPVISAGRYEFPLSDFDKVVAAIEAAREEARKPKSVQVTVAPGIVATVTKDGITVNGQKLNGAALTELNAALEEVKS